MAKRQNVVTVPSDTVQGEGSWVKLRKLTVGEAKTLARTAETLNGGGEVAIQMTGEILASHIVGWDWVGTEGEPLPLPKDKPEIIDELTGEELNFLALALVGDQKKQTPSASN